MARQQRRAAAREAVAAKTRKAPTAKRPSSEPAVVQRARRLRAEDLSDLQVAAVVLAASVQAGDGRDERQVLNDERVWYVRAPRGKEQGRRVHDVTRRVDNRRGTLTIAYSCDCPDFATRGFNGCVHTLAEEIVRGEIVVVGKVSDARARVATARRRPSRKRTAENGQSVRTTQRTARERMPEEIPRLVASLRKAYMRELRENAVAARNGNVVVLAHRPPTDSATRAACLLLKICLRKAADGVRSELARIIADGRLPDLSGPPHQNTFTTWFQDRELTPILQRWLAVTSYAFRRREVGAIIDSSKVSQMRTAHHRGVEYLGDERDGADWMRCHVLVGVETMVVMAAAFGPNRGLGKTHDSLYLRPLVSEALNTFRLHYLLGDKAYWGRPNIEWLWDEAQIRAVIPAKKNTEREPGRRGRRGRREVFDPWWDLIKWQDERERDFHQHYRLRPKIEGFFSLLKRVADEHMWSRGRRYADGTYDPMRDGPCVAWINEALCKLIYMNLRATVTLQEETGVEIDYLAPERCFPPPIDALIKVAA
jgi:hypothetical protein